VACCGIFPSSKRPDGGHADVIHGIRENIAMRPKRIVVVKGERNILLRVAGAFSPGFPGDGAGNNRFGRGFLEGLASVEQA